MSHLNRRNFLLTSAAVLGSSFINTMFPLLNSIARAQSVDGGRHFFVAIHAGGAMDVTCGLDPQILSGGLTAADLFLDYKPSEILKRQGLSLAPGAASLLEFSQDIAVVNGIVMASNKVDPGHDVASQYIISGNSTGSSYPLNVQIGLGEGPAPFGTLLLDQKSFINIDLRTTQELPLMDLNNLINNSLSGAGGYDPNGINPDAGGRAFSRFVPQNTDYGSTMKTFADAAPYRQPFTQNLMQIIQQAQNRNNLPQEIAGVAAAFLANAASTALILPPGLGGTAFDTHQNHPDNHLRAQKDFWSYVAQFFKTFKAQPYGTSGESLFDRTTFLISSEFSRTPALNSEKGKDHNPETNSVVLAGRGVKGGKSIGQSVMIPKGANPLSRHVGGPFDFKAGTAVNFKLPKDQLAELHKRSEVIRPENIAATLLGIFSKTELPPTSPFAGVKPLF